MSVIDCAHCDSLRRAALMASKAYHELLADLEAAHIRRDLEAPELLSAGLKKALHKRNTTIAELTIHENAHVHKKPAEGRQQLSKRQSA